MKRIDRFILKAFIGPFVAILLVVVFILMMQFLWLYIDELVGKGLGLGVILEFILLGGTTILPLALPLATILAAMMTLGQMSENFELTALKTAGLSSMRIMSPVFVASILISGVAFYTSDNLVPKAYARIFTLRQDINNTKDEIKIPSGIFYDGIEGYVLRVEDRDEQSGVMYNVMVYDHTGNRGNTTVTLADSALMKMSKAKDYLTFTLYNGTNYQETNSRHYQDTTLEVQKVNFLRQELIIPLENYSFAKSDSTRFKDQIKSMTYSQLKDYQDTLNSQFRHEYDNNRILFTHSGIFMQQRQLDSASIQKNVEDFSHEKYMVWDNLDMQESAYIHANQKCEDMIVQLQSFNRNVFESQYFLRRTDHWLMKKFADAFACLMLFLIGAPLGAFVKRGKLGVSAIVAVLFFAMYWVIDMVGTKLANDGAINAFCGAFLPAFIMVPLGIFFMWKAAQDSDLFNTDQVKSKLRKLKSKIFSMFKKTRIVYMGTPDFAVAPLDALISAGYNVVGVVTVADKPSGRGLKVNESAVKKYAVEHGIPVLQPLKLKDHEFLEALKAWKADLFVVVAFRMLPKEVWTMPKLGTFNLHAALLPQYRGAAPINWAVINGERITGVTSFMIDEDIDTGGIMLRQDCRIDPSDTAGDVHDRLMQMGASLVVDTVEGIIQGNIETRVQRSFIQGSEVLKPAPKLTRELCHIDWNDSTASIYNLIRGLSPYPTAYTEIIPAGSTDAAPVQMKIFSAEKMSFNEAGCSAPVSPGTVLSDGKNFLAIATADGAIRINELQLAGKKRMEAKAFLLGFRNPEQYVCTEGTSKAEIAKTRA